MALAAPRAKEHRFFTGMALAALLVALIGFAPSYYLRSFSTAEPLSTLDAVAAAPVRAHAVANLARPRQVAHPLS